MLTNAFPCCVQQREVMFDNRQDGCLEPIVLLAGTARLHFMGFVSKFQALQNAFSTFS